MTVAVPTDRRIPLVDLEVVHRPMADDLRAAFERVLRSSSFVDGVEVASFEAALAELVGVPHAIGVASGTAALQLALLAAGVGPGQEVVVPANTFFATAEAVMATGAAPVLADVDVATGLLDPEAVEAAVTPRTAAVAAVHLYGQPVDADRFEALARRHGLFLLEDAAQAIGAAWRNRTAGSLGDAAGFSFYPGKNLGALGDGGAVTTADADLARRVRLLRNHGEEGKGVHVVAGFCERLDELQAAFLVAKLAHLPAGQAARGRAVEHYRRRLAELRPVQVLETAAGARHAHHLLVVKVPRRDAVLASLHAAGVGASVHYRTPIHLQPAGRHLGHQGQFPVAEALADSILSLPLYPGMSEVLVDRCVKALATALDEAT
ncbi:MAG TPA: DegT/DnrJ/EryC1/StrS family aminotransferase [Acidimicrobiales bacterium]|nr:DegT/DnrJ/EryC1/StrS family aminotransferase [Acidimicrobiales bacterium]